MNSLLAGLLESFGAALLGLANSFWIAAAAAALVWATLRFVWRGNAATRHAAWWALLVVVMLTNFAACENPPGPLTITSWSSALVGSSVWLSV